MGTPPSTIRIAIQIPPARRVRKLGEALQRIEREVASTRWLLPRAAPRPGHHRAVVFVDGAPWTVGTRLRERGAGMFIVMTHGPDFGMDELRCWLAWRDEHNAQQSGTTW